MPRIIKRSHERILRKNRRRFRSRVNPKQQKTAATTVALLSLIILFSMMALPNNNVIPILRHDKNLNAEILDMTRKSSIAKDPKKDYGSCEIEKAITPKYPIQPTFTASYPGSGAKMTWKLIEAMTGLRTGDDHNLNGENNVVSIKTHYPSNEGRAMDGAERIPRAFLLIRNPLYSIPSYFNFLYEYENKLPGHSTKAPVDEWIKWRNDNFERQVQVWRRHTEYWMDAYDKLHRSVISYERLIDDQNGPSEAMKVAEFLNRSDGVGTVAPNVVPCVWHTIVKYNSERRRLQTKVSSAERGSARIKEKDERPLYYDPDESVVQISLNEEKSSKEKSSSNRSREKYQREKPKKIVTNNIQVEEGSPTSNVDKQRDFEGRQSDEDLHDDQSREGDTVSSVEEQRDFEGSKTDNVLRDHSSGKEGPDSNAEEQRDSEEIKTDYMPRGHSSSKEGSDSNVEEQRDFEENHSSREGGTSYSDQKTVSSKENLRGKKDSPSYSVEEINDIEESLYSKDVGTDHNKKKTQVYRKNPSDNEDSGKSDGTKEGDTSVFTKKKVFYKETPREGDSRSHHVKDEGGHKGDHKINHKESKMEKVEVDPESKRGGPDYIAPFNEPQLKALIQVLTQLLERYRDDKDLAPILVTYIEDTAIRSRGPPEDENVFFG